MNRRILVSACLLGVCCRYDGSFSGTLKDRDGVTTELLRHVGIEVYGESRVREVFG